jgi:hypothetical protein
MGICITDICTDGIESSLKNLLQSLLLDQGLLGPWFLYVKCPGTHGRHRIGLKTTRIQKKRISAST